jgi:methylamine dehydrogenase accessory protein MauD
MDWSTIGWASYIILWVVVLVQLLLTLSLARLIGQLTRRFPAAGALTVDSGPELGQALGDFQGTTLRGEPLNLSFPRSHHVFFFYLTPGCSTCDELMPVARVFFREIAGEAETVIVMVHGSGNLQQEYVEEQGLGHYRILAEEQLPKTWYVGGAPYGVWVDGEGVVRAKGLVNRREHLESLRHAAAIGVPTIQSLHTTAVHQLEAGELAEESSSASA